MFQQLPGKNGGSHWGMPFTEENLSEELSVYVQNRGKWGLYFSGDKVSELLGLYALRERIKPEATHAVVHYIAKPDGFDSGQLDPSEVLARFHYSVVTFDPVANYLNLWRMDEHLDEPGLTY